MLPGTDKIVEMVGNTFGDGKWDLANPDHRAAVVKAVVDMVAVQVDDWLKAVPFGVSPSKESYLRLPQTGNTVAVETYDANDVGTGYVRVLDASGGEVGYWSADEVGEEPGEVLGAIFGAMLNKAEPKRVDHYQFGPDVKFPDGVEFTPHVDTNGFPDEFLELMDGWLNPAEVRESLASYKAKYEAAGGDYNDVGKFDKFLREEFKAHPESLPKALDGSDDE